jgi:hypothetical protein
MVNATNNTLTELDVLREAAEAIQDQERLRLALRASDDRLRALCRAYDRVGRAWGMQPEHLRRECAMRGLL